MPNQTVLICTTSTLPDPGVPAVINALEERGARAFRFDTDLFPYESKLSVLFGEPEHLVLTTKDGSLDLSELSAVWVRLLEGGEIQPSDMDQNYRQASRAESNAMLWGTISALSAFQLDPIEALSQSPGKLRQLQLAKELGLHIPKTLFSNDPDEVRGFARSCKGEIISKMVQGVRVESEEGEPETLYTEIFTQEDLEDLDGLELCPMIFQELIPKKLELRVTVVGHQVFAAAIDPSKSELGAVDWRKDPSLVSGFKAYPDLPAELRSQLLTLLDKCGLNFATFDLILTPDDRYVFLEFNNSMSHFYFIERSSGLLISGAIADLLLGRSPSRVAKRSK